MKYWKSIEKENLSYSEAIRTADFKGGQTFITRPEWDGIHFVKHNHYFILLKTGDVIEDPISVHNISSNDWIVVTITDEAKYIIDKVGLEYEYTSIYK